QMCIRDRAGILDAEINIPPLPAGKKLLRVYAHNTPKQKEYRTCRGLEVVEPDLELTLAYDAPTTFPLSGKEFIVNVTLGNPTRLTLPEVAVKIAYGNQEQIILEKKLSLPAGEQWTPKIKLQAEKPDVYRLLATASLTRPDDKSTTYSVWQKELFVPVFSPTAKPAIVVNSREIKVTPEPLTFDAIPTFIIPLYNLTDKAQQNLICEIRCSEDKEFIEQIEVDNIEGLEQKAVSITASKSLSPGEKNIFIFVYQSEHKPEKGEMPPANAFVFRHIIKVNKYADLIVVPDSMKFSRQNYLNGDTIRVEALIKNIGDITANNIEVAGYANRPLMAVNLISPTFSENPIKIIDELKPGEERAVAFRWDRFGTPGTIPIFIVVNPAKKITENDLSCNEEGMHRAGGPMKFEILFPSSEGSRETIVREEAPNWFNA
ncbi:MAG: hypothetical protein N2246_10790, partial [Candidatus Sumerlaeia bacterium]|nr:hypothetical protein [Candidatus Sumerlaeia bacterium]